MSGHWCARTGSGREHRQIRQRIAQAEGVADIVLRQAGRQSLLARQIDPDNSAQLCRFGRSELGAEDAIGQFLTAN
ncbi:DUF5333 family protein [Aliiroseovarius sp.]|uniref:DUF5333 family protein n=1 Tax=Aliiroseovarius sp. TaxID=1872442 RepID=UPI003BAB7D9D